ncbi:MAG: hypothetical protein H7A36_01765 [Chlamydiales bacterium]|nr:hypothetical protein [Chlamydiales bacterium]
MKSPKVITESRESRERLYTLTIFSTISAYIEYLSTSMHRKMLMKIINGNSTFLVFANSVPAADPTVVTSP